MWKDFDLKGWCYKGRDLANPLLISWRLFWWALLQVFMVPACLCAWLGWGRHTAERLWREAH